MSQLRLGLVGAGAVAELHVDAALARPDLFRVTAVADPRVDVARHVAGRCDAVPLPSHEELAGSGLVDAVVVASPHEVHCEQVVDLVTAGLPVLVEKPMALSAADCDRMVKAGADAGVPLVVGHLQRYLPTITAARELLEKGRIGRPRMFLERRSARYEAGTRPDWFLDPRGGAGGILTNLGPHCVDKLFRLTGSRTARATCAWSGGGAVVTEVAAMLDLGDDVRAAMVLTGTGLPNADVSEVVGTTGALRIDRADGVVVFANGEIVHQVPAGPDDIPRAFGAQLADFHATVVDGRPPVVGGDYGRDVLAVLDDVLATAGGPAATPLEESHV